jgi:uncharacterized protein YdaU (DUF1376 family)
MSTPTEIETQLPWFQFYVGDVYRRIEDMNTTEIGAYLLLLMYHWNHSCLPAEGDMARVARLDAKRWNAMKQKVLSRVRHDVSFLDEQKAKAKAKSEKARKAAHAKWNANGYADASFEHLPQNAS